jgi:hypothetical protein
MPAIVDLSGLRSALEFARAAPARVDQVQQRARGTLSRRLLVEARRDIQQEYALPAQRIMQGLRVRNAGDGVELTGFKRGVGLINFRVRGGLRGKPVQAAVRRDEAMSDRFGAFIARAPNGSQQVFVRASARTRGQYGLKPEKQETTKGRYAGTGIKREPLDVLYGPSVAQMLGRPERIERLTGFGQRIVRDEIERQFT